MQDAGVVVEDVEGPAGVRGELGQRVGPLLGFPHVEGAGDPVRMVGLHLREGLGIDVVDTDGPSFAAEPFGGGEADSGGSAGDEDG